MLDHKIPPLLLTLLFAGAMAFAGWAVPSLSFGSAATRMFGIVAMLAGAAVCVGGVLAFCEARTTVDPTHPDMASTLVRSGVYRFTRNPMYLGFLLVLGGLAFVVANWLALAIALCFVPYMNRFQIEPEERALESLFGAEFNRFRSEVRRWL